MKKVIFAALILILGMSLLTGCQEKPITTENKNVEEFQKDDLKMEDLALGSLKIGMAKEKVIDLMGEATRIEEHPEGHDVRFFYEDNLQVMLMDDVVYFIETLSAEYPTPRGLKVGDTKEKLIELYGEPTEITEDSSTEKEIYHFDLSGEYYLFHAEIKDDKIVRLQVNSAD